MSGGIYNGKCESANSIRFRSDWSLNFGKCTNAWLSRSKDEVGALVFDPGHQSFRVGYAGEDIPKIEVPSIATFVNDQTDAMETDLNQKPSREYLIDNAALRVPRKNGELHSFLKDCMSKNGPELSLCLCNHVP